MTAPTDDGFTEVTSPLGFAATLARVVDSIEAAGLTIFAQIDHAENARASGLEMPPTTLLIYGNAKGGTPIMVAAPRSALDLPLRVLVREAESSTAISFHAIAPTLLRAGVPESLAHRLDAAQRLLTEAIPIMSAGTTVAETMPARWRFDYFPVSLFGSVMGLTGLSIAWRLAHARYGAPLWAADGIGVAAVAAFILILVGYAVKAITAPDAIRTEFRHPIVGNLFGTLLISVLLLPIVLAPYCLVLAQVMWVAGAVGMVAFAWLIVSRWMSDRQLIAHATPAWIIPVVGLLDVPLALPSLGLPPMHGVMVLGLAVGLFFAVPLFTLIFSRLLFEPPMPDALQPMLLILLAPFAVGFSTYVVTTGQVDLFAQSLYVLTLFVLAVLLGRLRNLIICCPFRVSWWAVSFPLAASAIAALRFAAAEPGQITDVIALALLALATITIAGLLVRTLVGLARGELRTLTT